MTLEELSEMVWNGVVAVMLWCGLSIVISHISQDPHRGIIAATIITVAVIVQNYLFGYT